MAFCSFSKEFDDNSYVTIENKFITKYLPQADGFAVKVYLYGLYVCKHAAADFSLASMAEVLQTDENSLMQAFAFWEDFDLVEIISKTPFAVQYLPVKSAVGRPKKIRYEQYADFNKELQRKMQKVEKHLNSGDYIKYMHFLEETSMQPQALLLVAEYCISKQGKAVSPAYIFNKARKLIAGGAITYEQVERELSSYHANESELISLFNAMGLKGSNGYPRVPDDNDYSLYRKWTQTLEFEKDAIIAAAKNLTRGTMHILDTTLEDLYAQGKKAASEITAFMQTREKLASLTFRIGRKLGVKVSNPATYVEEYVEKWCALGFDDNALLDIALFCLKNDCGNFEDMHKLVQKLAKANIVDGAAVKAYIKERNDELKTFAKIQETCGNIRRSASALQTVKAWKEWGFSLDMILEAAKRSCASANPLPYMNKILSAWKDANVFSVKNIPETTGAGTSSTAYSSKFVNPTIEAANAKSARERYYALLREQAQKQADAALAKANKNARFKQISLQLSKMELSLAKAEMYQPETLPTLTKQKSDLMTERVEILSGMGLSESDLLPKFACQKCSDTGFLKNGKSCDCYKG